MSTGTAKPTATPEQVARIAELYESRAVPEEKKRDPATLTERGVKRWITLLEAYPLTEETVAGIGGAAPTREAAPYPQRRQRGQGQGAGGQAAGQARQGCSAQAGHEQRHDRQEAPSAGGQGQG